MELSDTTKARRHTRDDSGLALDRELRWWHDGERVEHPNIIEAFNRGLKVRADGRVVLELGEDWCFVEVAGCAFGVVAVDVSEGERLSVRLSDRTAEWLDHETLSMGPDDVPQVHVKSRLAWARFTRDAWFQVASWLSNQGPQLVLQVGGRSWPVPSLKTAP